MSLFLSVLHRIVPSAQPLGYASPLPESNGFTLGSLGACQRSGLCTAFMGIVLTFIISPALRQDTAQKQNVTDETVAATVNGEEITIGDLKTLVSLTDQAPPLTAVYPQVIQQVTQRRLIAQAAKAAGIDADPEIIKRIAVIRRGMMIETYLQREGRKQLTDEKLRAEYDRVLADNPPQETVRARHILLASQTDAEAAITRLREGADFAELAKELSTGPSGVNGGDLGYFRKGDMVPEFSQAAFAMAVGSHSETPTQTQFGWHVIFVEDRKLDTQPSFEELRPTLEQRLIGEASRQIVENLIETGEIEIKDIDISAIE